MQSMLEIKDVVSCETVNSGFTLMPELRSLIRARLKSSLWNDFVKNNTMGSRAKDKCKISRTINKKS